MKKIEITKKICKTIVEKVNVETFVKYHLKAIYIYNDETVFYTDCHYNGSSMTPTLSIKKGYGNTSLSFDKNKEIIISFKPDEICQNNWVYTEIFNFIENNDIICF